MIRTGRVAKIDDLEVSLGIFRISHLLGLMGLCENFTVRARKFRSMISTIRLVENNNSEACDSILQLAIVWVVIGLSGDFTVRRPR